MKNLFLFLILIFGCVSTQHMYKPMSGNNEYKPFSKFKNDTLAYLKYNFDQKEFYRNKPLKVLLNDLEIPVKSSIEGDEYDYSKKIDVCNDLSLLFDPYLEGVKHSNKLIITVAWNTSIPYSDFEKHLASKNRNLDWNKQDLSFYGDNIVKEIYIMKH